MPRIYDENIDRKTVTSCGFLDPETICFIAGWSYEDDIEQSDVAEYYFVHALDQSAGDDARNYCVPLKSGSRRRIANSDAADKLLMVSADRHVHALSVSGGTAEQSVPRTVVKSITSVRWIGDHFYVTGLSREVARRDRADQWTSIAERIRPETRGGMRLGFFAIDGFNEQDIYAVGGEGDAWHYDGAHWDQLDLPTNMYLESVYCASDGQVYIGGNGHLVLRGRGDCWRIVNLSETNSALLRIVEYRGMVLAVDEWGSQIFRLDGERMTTLDTGDFVLGSTSAVCLAVAHDMLLTGGSSAMNLFDGQRWHRLFDRNGLADAALARTLLRQASEAVDSLNSVLTEPPED